MKHRYRGQLNNKKVVDIIDFEGEYAICDHGDGKMHIDDFNTIYFPKDVFKKDILGLEVEKVEIKKTQPKKTIKKS